MKKPTQTGVIFDWDGVIVDSSSAHERSWKVLADECNLLLPENYFTRCFGRRNEEIIRHVLGWSNHPDEILRMSEHKEDVYRKILGEEGLEPLPGVRRILEDLRQQKIPCAIGSSTCRKNVEFALELMSLPANFTGIITEECVRIGKPDPDVFLQAAQTLDLPPENIVVFEDSMAGIKAGLDGGFNVVGVATTNPPELLKRAGAHSVVSSLTEVHVGLIRALATRS